MSNPSINHVSVMGTIESVVVRAMTCHDDDEEATKYSDFVVKIDHEYGRREPEAVITVRLYHNGANANTRAMAEAGKMVAVAGKLRTFGGFAFIQARSFWVVQSPLVAAPVFDPFNDLSAL